LFGSPYLFLEIPLFLCYKHRVFGEAFRKTDKQQFLLTQRPLGRKLS
jgi:hypothetical protein